MTSGTTSEKIDAVDALRYENALLKAQNLDMQIQGLEAQRQNARVFLENCAREINEKYSLAQQDRVDLSTCVITRGLSPVSGEIEARAEELKSADKPKKAPKA